MPPSTQQEKAARIVAEGRVQILARSERGALALVTNEQGAIYQTTALFGPPGRRVVALEPHEWSALQLVDGPRRVGGTCTCKHGREREDPIYSHARGEGCKHYRALLMALEA